MKSIILYSNHSPEADNQMVRKFTPDGVCTIYVRAEVVDVNAFHALSMAKPREGETVLNAVEMP